jgi:sialate O-acetylesterase
MNSRLRLALLAGMLLSGALQCRGDITLPALISDNMILQHDEKISIWGKADPGESITVIMGPDNGQTLAGKDGNWAVTLDPLPSGGPYDMTVAGKNNLTVHNVAIGEVWVCAGESNMEFKTVAARNSQEEMADADLPMTRVFTVSHTAAGQPASDCQGSWVVCDPDSVKDFSAIAFFFARELNRGMRTPFGIIQATWGPSPAQAWTPRKTLESEPALSGILDHYSKAVAAYPQALTDYQTRLDQWHTAGGYASGPKPVPPVNPQGTREPAALFNGMIAPLLRYPIRGVLWYQGESNTGDPDLYAKLFPAMIQSWRAAWDEGAFPFFFAQLSGFLEHRAQPEESQWAKLREAQTAALALPKIGMVVTADIGEERNMHPPDKQDVAHRFALLAQSQVYEKDVTASGPVFESMDPGDSGQAVISFSHADGGLTTPANAPVKGFEAAGPDGRFASADASIKGSKVIVTSKEVPNPTAIRYDWANFPDGNLMNQAGLPAAPFRTDKPQ